jgi:thiosulfate/3-mercaptopyruvate sulfurtransferase
MKTMKKAVVLFLFLLPGTGLVFASGRGQQQDSASAKGASGLGGAAANPGKVISAAQLKEFVDSGDQNLVIIGVINPAAALIPFSPASKPIEGSYLVWRGDYSGGGTLEAISPEVTGVRKSKEDMEKLLSRAGVTTDSKIVVYSADAMHDAARFAWQLRVLGLENVSYLDGGVNAWIDAGYPTGKSVRLADQSPKGEFRAPNYDPQKYDMAITQVRDALRSPGEWVVIDTRTKDEYDGKRTGNSSGAFGTGRLKGVVHINWADAVDADTQLLKSKAELERIYGNVIKGKKVITYCQSGVRSAHTWLVLTELLGAKEVYNYDGSWIEWSFAASSASGNRYADILELTEEWNDNKKSI